MPSDECALRGCTNQRRIGAHYCSPECEEKAAGRGTRITGAPAERHTDDESGDRDA